MISSGHTRAPGVLAGVLALVFTLGCGGATVEAPTPAFVPPVNDNLPPVAVASSSMLDRDASFFLRLDVAALRASPVADVLRDGQRRAGLFRDATGTTFDPVEGLDAVASTAHHARLTQRGISSGEWTVVALVRRAGSPREVVEATVLRGEAWRWQERGAYAMAEFAPMWRGHGAFVGLSREIIVIPLDREPSVQATLLEQLASVASPIDPVLVFDPGKLGEIRLATSGLPFGIAGIHLSGAAVAADGTLADGVLIEGEIVPQPGVTPTAMRADLERVLHDPLASTVLQAMGLAALPSRVLLRDTVSDVRVTARLEWSEVGRIVRLVTDTASDAGGDRRSVTPVPPPPPR